MAERSKEEFEGELEVVEEQPRRAYSKAVVAVCLVLVLAFTVTELVFLWCGKPLNDALTTFFFACFGIEFASLAFVTRGKLKYTGGNGANRQLSHIEMEDEDDSETGK